MPFVIFVAPFLTPVAVRQIAATADLPDVRLGVISQEPQERLPEHIQHKLAAHWRVDDGWSTSHILGAARALAERDGPIYRLFGAAEHLQVQVAQVREELGFPGIGVETTWNFRDKARMKTLLREADLPCARHWLVNSDADVWRIANEVRLSAGDQAAERSWCRVDLSCRWSRGAPSDPSGARSNDVDRRVRHRR